MSKASTPIKVLRTALKRVNKGWTQGVWSDKRGDTTYVCLEGALFGYCDQNKHGLTEAQEAARAAVLEIILERYEGVFPSIPSFNDARSRTQEEIQEVIKLAIIRLETDDDGIDDDDFDELLENMNNH